MRKPITFVTHYVAIEPRKLVDMFIADPTFANPNILEYPHVKASYYSQCKELSADNNTFINLMFESAKRLHVDARCVLLTDEGSKVEVSNEIKICRFKEETSFLYINKIEAFIAWLKQQDGQSNILLLDWDMLIQKKLTSIFEGQCDLIFTVRDYRTMPINGGFIGIRGESITKVISFFEEVVEYLTHLPSENHKNWYGDQMAYEFLLRDYYLEVLQKKAVIYKEINICFLDAKIYNFSPNELGELYPDNAIIHFKSTRKLAMIDYWRRFLQQSPPLF